MKYITIIILIFLAGCTATEHTAKMANPASVFCTEKGYKLEIRNTAEGQEGYCIFSDGTECEEWAYFRGECPASEKTENTSNEESSDTVSNIICKQLPLSSELNIGDRYHCLAAVNHNPDFCEEIKADEGKELDEEEKNNKNFCLALANENSSYCKKMTTPESKKTCYNVLAQASKNLNVCSDVDYSVHDKQQCYFNYVNALYWENKSELITLSDCEKVGIDQSNEDKNTCLAFKQRDISLCGNNKNCLTFFPQEMSFCSGAAFKDKNECIRDRAMTTKNISICETLPSAERDNCIGDFSSHINQSTLVCDKISNEQHRQGCYIDAAINLAK